MNKESELCCHLNDLLYEVKTTVSKHSPLQGWINKVMLEYQSYFGKKELEALQLNVELAHKAAKQGEWDRVREIFLG